MTHRSQCMYPGVQYNVSWCWYECTAHHLSAHILVPAHYLQCMYPGAGMSVRHVQQITHNTHRSQWCPQKLGRLYTLPTDTYIFPYFVNLNIIIISAQQSSKNVNLRHLVNTIYNVICLCLFDICWLLYGKSM